MRLLLLLLVCAAALPAPERSEEEAAREFVQAVEFPYYLYPRPLWERELVWLKTIGIRTVAFSIPWNWHQLDRTTCDFTGRTSPRRDLAGFIRTLHRLQMRAWIRPLAPVKGWLNNGYPAWAAPDRKQWLHDVADLLGPRVEKHGGPIAFVEDGTGILDAPAPPAPVTVVSARDAGVMVRSRQALAAAHGSLVWQNVEDALYPAGWELPGAPLYVSGAVSLDGEERPTAADLRRNAALLRHWAALLPAMKTESARTVKLATGKFPHGVTATEVVARNGVAAAVAISNESGEPFQAEVHAWDPFEKHAVPIPDVRVAPQDSLWLPLNVSLGGGGLCRDCTNFSSAERIVYATAELQSIEFENGTLALEFAAPEPAEALLQLARRPEGPYLAGGHPRDYDFDEKTLRVRLKIPAGKGPAHQVRVALAIEPPDSSAFFEDAKRLIIGQDNIVSTSYSSEELAVRSRLRLPEGFSAKAVKSSPLAIDYAVSVPSEALHGDWADLALEADGVPMGRAHLQLFRPASIRLPEAIRLHFGAAELLVEPPIIPMDATAGRTLDVTVRNNWPQIETYTVEPNGDGFQFLPPRAELNIAPVAERIASLRVFPGSVSAGLHDWLIRFSGGTKLHFPARFLVIPRGQAVAWSADLDGDGSPEWVIENQKARAIFSTQDGGRWLEFVWKDSNLNVLPENGALAGNGPVEVRAGNGSLEFSSPGWKRTVRLAGPGASLTIEQSTNLPAETLKAGKRNEVNFEVKRESASRAIYTLTK